MKKKACLLKILMFSLIAFSQITPQWVQSGGIYGCNKLIIKLAAVPQNGGSNFLIAVTDNKVYRSTDDGQMWIETNSGMADNIAFTCCLVVDKKIFLGANNTIYLSDDGGASWKPSGNGLKGNINKLTYISKGTDTLKIFAGTTDGLYVSSDYGNEWKKVDTHPSSGEVRQLASAPNSSGGENLFLSNIFSNSFVSKDNGKTWNYIDYGIPVGTPYNIVSITGSNEKNIVYVFGSPSNEQKVIRSTDGGDTWTEETGLYGKKVYTLNSDGKNIYAGTGGGGILFSTDFGNSWDSLDTGALSKIVNGIEFFPNINSTKDFYATTYFNNYFGGGIYRSVDQGKSWKPLNNGIEYMPINTLTKFKEDTGNEKLIAGVVYYGVFISSDEGKNWEESNEGMTALWVQTIAVDGVDMFVGTYNGGVFYSDNYGKKWKPVNKGLSTNQINKLIVFSDENNVQRILAATSKGVFSSTDKGNNWFSANNGLPASFASSIIKIPNQKKFTSVSEIMAFTYQPIMERTGVLITTV